MYQELVLNNEPKSVISETIRTLRTNLQFASIDKKLRTILITSSVPGEGKSFIAANLAVAFAQSGTRVLLVDCDIRKGRQKNRRRNSSGREGIYRLECSEGCRRV